MGWVASPNAIAVFGNQGAQLQKWAMNSYDAFKKIDKDLYQTMPLRLYMDSELTILS